MSSIVRVLPDVPALDRELDYLLPADLPGADRLQVGTMVRVPLSGRRVAGWVTAVGSEPPQRELREVLKVVGRGPTAEVVGLCRWAAWRWAGRLPTVMRLASPPRVVPFSSRRPSDDHGVGGREDPPALVPAVEVHEVSPITDPYEVVEPLLARGPTIVVAPSVTTGESLVRRLARAGHRVAHWPRDWVGAASGAHVVGGRSAVFAPVAAPAAIVVLDEHDDGHQSEQSPTWNAREVAVERARRTAAHCALVSPCPSLHARYVEVPIAQRRDLEPPAPTRSVDVATRRSGWAPVTVIDRRGGDRREGLYSSRLVGLVRETARRDGRVLCVLNRTGRARLLVCRGCGTTALCERCDAAVRTDDETTLSCQRCGAQRPMVCTECGSTALANLRQGVTRAREELEALVREPVAAVTAQGDGSAIPSGVRVMIGTTALLHRVNDADLVAFVDFDQELFASRYRASEEALALVVLANRCLGGRTRGGRLVLQTRVPEHEVVRSALRADPRPVTAAEAERRALINYPPFGSIAVLGGEAAPEYVERLGDPPGVAVMGPDEGSWLLRAPSPQILADALAEVHRPPGRLRLWVDPVRLR